MSYYHYFKLKDESKYQKEDALRELKFKYTSSDKDKILLKVSMIKAYYENKIETNYTDIFCRVKLLATDIEEDCLLSLVKEIKEHLELLIKEKGEIERNRPHDEYEMEQIVNSYNEDINRIIENLLILSTIRFVPDNEYSDTPKTEMDYLRYEYITQINYELETLEDTVLDYTFSKFVLEECNRETESERSSSEDSQ